MVGEDYPDLIVEQYVIVEIKAAQELVSEHEAQLLNYLKATGIEVRLLLNFCRKPEVKRKVLSRGRSDPANGNVVQRYVLDSLLKKISVHQRNQRLIYPCKHCE